VAAAVCDDNNAAMRRGEEFPDAGAMWLCHAQSWQTGERRDEDCSCFDLSETTCMANKHDAKSFMEKVSMTTGAFLRKPL
jgi:hypothetical protein